MRNTLLFLLLMAVCGVVQGAPPAGWGFYAIQSPTVTIKKVKGIPSAVDVAYVAVVVEAVETVGPDGKVTPDVSAGRMNLHVDGVVRMKKVDADDVVRRNALLVIEIKKKVGWKP